MTMLLTKNNLEEVLRQALELVEKADGLLSNPGCDCDEVGEYRCNALHGIRKAEDAITEVIHKCYLLK